MAGELDFGGGKAYDCDEGRVGLASALATIERYEGMLNEGAALNPDQNLGYANALTEAHVLRQAAARADHEECLGRSVCLFAAEKTDS